MSAAVTELAYAICSVRDIPNRRAKGFHLVRMVTDGDAAPVERPWHIVVVRWDRKLYAYVNICPHQGTNLDWEADQFFDGNGTHLVCGKHGSLFEVTTGACIDGPCKGAALKVVKLTVVDGDVCVSGVVLAEAEDDEENADDSGV
jgi:nitrite reductase/ring-hydroxylating ferredoxin subunit